jgi:mRNA interferase YafQ
MREIAYTKTFRRDVKRVQKQGKDTTKLATLHDIFSRELPVPPHYKDHPLKSNWRDHRELHIEPDWLLIYRIAEEIVYFVRTGSHAELFQN